MANILPNQIHDYPQGGELQYLFTKKLTRSDLKLGLMLVGDSNDYFSALPVYDTIASQGLDIDLYTPNGVMPVSIKCRSLKGTNFFFRKSGWVDGAQLKGFNVGDGIDCWVLYQANEGRGGTFSLLVQKVANQAQAAADGEGGN